MKLQKLSIEHYRSIEKVEINFSNNFPLVLFGPNNAGKSNILKAIECLLGEKYASYIDFEDSDFYERDRSSYPKIFLTADFDAPFYRNYKYNKFSNKICFSTNFDSGEVTESTFHFEGGGKMYLSNEDRIQCQFILVDATRDISRQLSYYSKYSILSRMSKKMHSMLIQSAKDELDKSFKNIKNIFEKVPEYKRFYENLQNSFSSNIEGFEHRLEIDLSAYDPNNYFNALRIIAKENETTRSFNEFGTGEQQILLMSFIKAYAETFKGEYFILGIEEPEAHLHPLAQKWLAKNIENLCNSGVQTIITTHSPEFLNIENLEGFIRVYKDGGITKIIQHNAKSLSEKCIELGASIDNTMETTILQFYKTNTFYDQLKGFFARKIILVEGPTEMFSIQNYFSNSGYNLNKEGVEILDCKGKSQIARNYRLFKSYGYECFCIFDADEKDDEKKRANKELGVIFEFDPENMITDRIKFTMHENKPYGYFGKDYENYLRANFENYSEKEKQIKGGKILKAKVISEENKEYKPLFIEAIAANLKLKSLTKATNKIGIDISEKNSESSVSDVIPEDIPF